MQTSRAIVNVTNTLDTKIKEAISRSFKVTIGIWTKGLWGREWARQRTSIVTSRVLSDTVQIFRSICKITCPRGKLYFSLIKLPCSYFLLFCSKGGNYLVHIFFFSVQRGGGYFVKALIVLVLPRLVLYLYDFIFVYLYIY